MIDSKKYSANHLKHCSRCNQDKNRTEFSKTTWTNDQLNIWCKPCKYTYQKEYRKKNHKRVRGAELRSKIKRKESGKEREYVNRKYKTDILHQLSKRLRDRLRGALRRYFQPNLYRKRCSAVKSLGCSLDQLKLHLENQFKPGMTWENRGKAWHIDHIKPISKFNLLEQSEQEKACHYTNLQPLWAKENLSKGNKYE